MDFTVLIVRLSPFKDVMKSTTHQFLYGECARVLDDAMIDFAFLPRENDRKAGKGFVGIRTGRPAKEFDLILVSNSYAAELVNLPFFLKSSSIPYRSSKRREQSSFPLIIMGGSNALSAQAVLYDDDDAFVDGLFFGEGEGGITKLVDALSHAPREARWDTLRSQQGVVEGLKVFSAPPATIKKAIVQDLSHDWLASAKQYLFDSSEATTVRLQISYGCPFFCTFCFEGWERKPYREVSYDALYAAAKDLKKRTGADTLEITTFNFNTHTDVTKLFLALNKLFFRVNFMSQRADILAANPALLPFEVASDKRQFTIGVEGISQRMRTYFHKNLDTATIRKVLTQLLSSPIREVKLFFILSGLETSDDIEDFRKLLAMVASLKESLNRGIRILCSFGLLVRMPFTPLRYAPLLLRKEQWDGVVEAVKRTVEGAGYEFRLTYPYEEYFLSQVLVMYPRPLAPALESLAEKGIVYDLSFPEGTWSAFSSQVDLDPAFLNEKDESYPFAFPFVDTRTPSSFLYRRYLDAKEGKEHPSCMGSACAGCGSCTPEQRTALNTHVIHQPTHSQTQELEELVKAKARSKPVYVLCNVPKAYAPSRPETKEAYAMRTMMASLPDGETKIMTVRDVWYEDDMPWWYGDTVYAVYPFSPETRPQLMASLSRAGMKVYDQIPEMQVEACIEGSGQKVLESAAKTLLDDMHLPYVLSRHGNETQFTIAPKALKKHVVTSCKIEENMLWLRGSSKMHFSALSHGRLSVVMKLDPEERLK